MDSAAKADILLVDDEPKNLYALRELLAAPDRHLLLAGSGEEALRLTLQHEPALILLDVRMPRMDGFETARLIRGRERSRHTPIIFLTAAAEELGSVFRGYEVGAVDYLIKPLVPEVLKSKVAVFVELHRRGAELTREIAERRAAEERARRSEEQLRALAAYLISVREEERTHVAREIHDELGQVLTGLKMDIAWLARQLQDAALREKTDSMARLVDATVQTVRRIATRLRPEVLDEMGLVAAIGWQATEFQKRTGIRARLALPPESETFAEDVAVTVFRIFQEILTNIARHARASRVDVVLRRDADRVELEVVDNGVGIDMAEAERKVSLGLLGMQERALRLGGRVQVSGTAGQGTRVAVSLPIAKTHAAENPDRR
jgi:signal transduction histidine kinase